MAIKELIEEWQQGEEGFGSVILHKKPHKTFTQEGHACFRGTMLNCENAYMCPNLYLTKEGCYCLCNGQMVGGLLIREEKHRTLVERGAVGAYASVREAIESNEDIV